MKDLQNQKTKFTNRLLALNPINELNTYKKYISNYNVKLIIDSPFAKNKEFLFNLTKYKENITIYYAKNKQTPSLGMVYLCSKKK